MPQRRPYHVAIVGSGPSGYFAAASLLKFADSDDDGRRAGRHAGDAADAVGPGPLRRGARPSEDQVDQRPVREDGARPAVPVLRQHRGRRARAGHRAGRALRRGDLRGRRAVRPVAEHPRRGSAGQRRRRRLRRLVQRAPTLRGDGARPVDRAGRGGRQRQRRAGRGAHPGHRPRRARHHRHRRPRAEGRCTTAVSRRCSSSAGAGRCRRRSPRWSFASSATSKASATST